MKMLSFAVLLATLPCLFLFSAIASAQQPEAEQQQIEYRLRVLTSPMRQLDELSESLAAFRAPWEGSGTVAALRMAMRLVGADELGLSEEQKERLPFSADGDGMKQAPYEDFYDTNNPTPELAQAREALKAALIPGDPLFERATEEQKSVFLEAATKIDGLFQKTLQAEIEETLTPGQMYEVRKLAMQLMPEMGLPFPPMFEILDLTDEQKREMDKIAGEMYVEYDRLVLELLTHESEEKYSKYRSELQGKTFASLEELNKSFGEIRNQFSLESAESRKRATEFLERGTKQVTLLQNRVMNVLTDEQLDRMQEIMDETPASVKKFLVRVKAMREFQKKIPIYTPGPDAWQPGMPLPVEIKEERKKGTFPRPRSA